ncbi:unnamed protein product, partial [Musa textilis]
EAEQTATAATTKLGREARGKGATKGATIRGSAGHWVPRGAMRGSERCKGSVKGFRALSSL